MIDEQKRALVVLLMQLTGVAAEFEVLEYGEVEELQAVYRKILTRLHGHHENLHGYWEKK